MATLTLVLCIIVGIDVAIQLLYLQECNSIIPRSCLDAEEWMKSSARNPGNWIHLFNFELRYICLIEQIYATISLFLVRRYSVLLWWILYTIWNEFNTLYEIVISENSRWITYTLRENNWYLIVALLFPSMYIVFICSPSCSFSRLYSNFMSKQYIVVLLLFHEKPKVK